MGTTKLSLLRSIEDGRYRELTLIGAGALGSIYRAQDSHRDRPVAIKLFQDRANVQDEAFAGILAQLCHLRHPNLVDHYESGVVQSYPYVTMEYLDGVPVHGGTGVAEPQTLVDAVEVAIAACRALAYLHQAGLLHRDVKPSNLFRCHNGRIVLHDLGLVQRSGDDSRTQHGTVVGTPLYMAPEQIQGKTIDQRADIYGVGATLYTLVTGRPPYEEETLAALFQRIIEGYPRAPRALNRQVTPQLEAAILKALATDPARRFDSAAQLGEALQKLADALPQSQHERYDITPIADVATGEFVPTLDVPVGATVVRFHDAAGALLVVTGAQAGTRFIIHGSATIGRARDCGLQIDDPSLAPHHARVFSDKGRLLLEDLAASTTTLVAGQRLSPGVPHILREHDEVRLGDVVLLVASVPREPVAFAQTEQRMALLSDLWAEAAAGVTQADMGSFVRCSRKIVVDLLASAIGLRVEREVAARNAVWGAVIEAPMLWIRHSRFPILFVGARPDAEVVDDIIERMGTANTPGFFAVVIVISPLGMPDPTRLIRDRFARSPYRYDVAVLGEREVASLVRENTSRRFVELLTSLGLDASRLSPYVVRGPVPENMFFGRAAELKRIAQGLAKGSYAVVAGRRMGKSSMLMRLTRLLSQQSRYYPVYVNCEAEIDYRGFLEALGHSLPHEAPLSARMLKRIFSSLHAEERGNRTLVLLVDEVDALLKQDAEQNKGLLFRALRAIAHEGGCRFVFSGSRVLYQHAHSADSPFFNFCEEIRLKPLTLEAVSEIVLKPMAQLGIQVEDKDAVVELVARCSSRHPNVVQYLCHAALDGLGSWRLGVARLASVSSTEAFMRYFVETAWSESTAFERLVSLYARPPEFSLDNILGALKQHGFQERLQVQRALEMLELCSLLERRGKGRYGIALQRFVPFVRELEDIETLAQLLAEQARGHHVSH